ncbi:MAG TPA: hypothetical protein VIW68_04830 [Candidatus Sulfotelmatobacter sp.]
MVAVLCLSLAGSCVAADPSPNLTATSALDRGFAGLYNLDFAGAQKDFSMWEANHPGNPVGPVSEAAGILFAEFNRLGVLEAQFYANNENFTSRTRPTADSAMRARFQAALARAEDLARSQLAKDPNDRDALFAMTLSYGLQADYAALIEKRNLASLHYTKEASAWAAQLLAVCHDCYDGFLATGFSKYVIGSLSPPLRWLLALGGVAGDRQAGIADLQLTAEYGHYLAPFARMLLAIAYVRSRDRPRAIQLLVGLRAQFPGNPLFAREISRLQAKP